MGKATSTTRRGNGPGWGGPAKGADPNRKPKTDFGPATNAQGHSVATPVQMNRRAMREEQAEQMKDMLYGLALKGESESARVQAATAFLNRVEGMPVARKDINLKLNPAEMTDEQLAAIAVGGLAAEE